MDRRALLRQKKKKYIIKIIDFKGLMVGFSRSIFEFDCITDKAGANRYPDMDSALRTSRRLRSTIPEYSYKITEVDI